MSNDACRVKITLATTVVTPHDPAKDLEQFARMMGQAVAIPRRLLHGDCSPNRASAEEHRRHFYHRLFRSVP